MSNVIEFKVVSSRQKTHNNRNIVKTIQIPRKKATVCASPIQVERVGWNMISIGFRLDCFEPNLVDLAMRQVCHAQYELYKVGRDNPSYEPMRSTFIVRIVGGYSLSEADEILTQIAALSAKEAYLKEISMRGSKVDVSELATPYAADPFNGSIVNRETVAILRRAGIQNAYEVAKNTREMICQLPGMTTKEVYKLEKSLAARGIYLNAAAVPSWSE